MKPCFKAIQNTLGIGSGHFAHPGIQQFRTLCGLAQHQYRQPEQRGFFLYATGIGRDELALTHESDERRIGQRFNHACVGQVAQQRQMAA